MTKLDLAFIFQHCTGSSNLGHGNRPTQPWTRSKWGRNKQPSSQRFGLWVIGKFFGDYRRPKQTEITASEHNQIFQNSRLGQHLTPRKWIASLSLRSIFSRFSLVTRERSSLVLILCVGCPISLQPIAWICFCNLQILSEVYPCPWAANAP
jgi:hypothetical protein